MPYGSPVENEDGRAYEVRFNTGVSLGEYSLVIECKASSDNLASSAVDAAFQAFIDAVLANTSYTLSSASRTKVFTEAITAS